MSDPSANLTNRRPMNRRRLLASAAGLTLAAIAAACGSSSTATTPPAAEESDPLAATRPLPYDPDDRDSILSRYARDRDRVDFVLAAGVPVLWITDAIW